MSLVGGAGSPLGSTVIMRLEWWGEDNTGSQLLKEWNHMEILPGRGEREHSVSDLSLFVTFSTPSGWTS